MVLKKRERLPRLCDVFRYDLDSPSYMPTRFMAKVEEKLGTKCDVELARTLQVTYTTIGQVRRRKIPISPTLMVRVHDLTGWSIDEIRNMAGIPKPCENK